MKIKQGKNFNHKALTILLTTLASILILGSFLYIFILRSINSFADKNIKADMKNISRLVFNVIDTQIIQNIKQTTQDKNLHLVTKIKSIAALEDFMRNEKTNIFIFEQATGKALLVSEKLNFSPPQLLALKLDPQGYGTIKILREKYYIYRFTFKLWNWNIYILKDVKIYSNLIVHFRTYILLIIISFVVFSNITLFLLFNKEIRLLSTAKIEAEKAHAAEVEARKYLEIANQAKTHFLDTISHELRTPIHALSGFYDVLSKQPEIQSSATCKKINVLILRSIERLSSIIIDLLSIQEFEQQTLELSEFKLATILEETVSSLLPKIKMKQLEFNSQYNFKETLEIRSDKIKLKQTMQKLLLNAVNFTSKGEIKLTITIDEQQNKFKFELSDTGIGIKKNQLQEIFKPLTQINQALNRQVQGIGMGLTICKKNIELLKGELSVESKFGKGSTFSFWIPIEIVNSH